MGAQAVFPVAVDFDGVLHSYRSPWTAHDVIPDGPVEGAIEWLSEVAAHYPVVIFTTRAVEESGRRAVASWLEANGFTGALHGITAVKPPAIFTLDDRAWTFHGPGTFPTIDDIARAKPWWAGREGSDDSPDADTASDPQELAGWRPELEEYFARKASTYDDVGDEPFWRLSDTVLWRHVLANLRAKSDAQFTFLDAGGGTGCKH